MGSAGLIRAVPALRVGHTSDIEPKVLERARSLLVEVFAGEFTHDDWEHSLGGVHVVAIHADEVVGHASVIQRRLLVGGRALRAGYVEGVGVHPDRQRQGIGSQMMAALERVIRTAYDIGALGATDEAVRLYTHRGWVLWRGPLSALTPTGIVATPDEAGGVYVLLGDASVDVDAELTCDWRDGDVW